MASLNKAMLIGNLGRDPEKHVMPSGESVCNFSIATTEKWNDKSGQKQEKTEWHNIVIFGKLADIAEQYLKKGSSVYLEGRIQTRKWQDKATGADRYSTEIVCDRMQMLGGKSDGGGSAPSDSASQQRQRPNTAAGNADGFEEDIDF